MCFSLLERDGIGKLCRKAMFLKIKGLSTFEVVEALTCPPISRLPLMFI
jgi:hypothetical protein